MKETKQNLLERSWILSSSDPARTVHVNRRCHSANRVEAAAIRHAGWLSIRIDILFGTANAAFH